MRKNQHVTPHPGGGWQVKGVGNERATAITDTQKKQLKLQEKLRLIKDLK